LCLWCICGSEIEICWFGVIFLCICLLFDFGSGFRSCAISCWSVLSSAWSGGFCVLLFNFVVIHCCRDPSCFMSFLSAFVFFVGSVYFIFRFFFMLGLSSSGILVLW